MAKIVREGKRTGSKTPSADQRTRKRLTVLFVEDNLHLQFGLALQALVDHGLFLLLRFRPVEELAGATLLHDLRPRESRQLAEAIGAVDDRIDRRHLRISQYKVAICEQKRRTTSCQD